MASDSAPPPLPDSQQPPAAPAVEGNIPPYPPANTDTHPTAVASSIPPPPATQASLPQPPPLPPRQDASTPPSQPAAATNNAPSTATGNLKVPPPPTQRQERLSVEEQQGIDSPVHYTRDPHRLVAYLVPFPKPALRNVTPDAIPQRFLIYTPPPPPLSRPGEGEKEGRVHKLHRKWQIEVREAKTSDAKTMSWKGVKGKATRGIDWAMGQTKNSNLEFVNRIGANAQTEPQHQPQDIHANDGQHDDVQTNATVKLEEMLLVYPASMPGDNEHLRQEFVNTMLRSKSKAERDAIIATGLLPVAAAIDVLATLVWPFGGLLEIDGVWAYASIRGAKTSRNVTKRLTSSSTTGQHEEDKLKLNFTPSPRLDVLERYLAARCHEKDSKLFPYIGAAPTETQVLEAIGWSPSTTEHANWEDEQWEITEVKEDLKQVMGKGAREWGKWSKLYESKPEKAMKR